MHALIVGLLSAILGIISINIITIINTPVSNKIPLIAIVFVIITFVVVCCVSSIISAVNTYISDFLRLPTYDSDKEVYQKQLDAYRLEFKDVLLKDFPKFEQDIQSKISDSKLLVAYLKENSYSKVLLKYREDIIELQNSIRSIDINKKRHEAELLAKQSWTSDCGLFIPKAYRFKISL